MRKNEFINKMEPGALAYTKATDNKTVHQKHVWGKWAAATACLCLMLTAIAFFTHGPSASAASDTIDEGCPAPHVVIGNRTYFISTHVVISNELPDGFAAAGTFENCPYFLNPDIPEWVYVYHEVKTDGEVDETDTLIDTPPP